MKKHIPNLLTSLNLVCGAIAVTVVLQEKNYFLAAYFIWIAGILDFFDGFAARVLKVSSPIGKELDSLADMVTFGLLPSLLVFSLLQDLSNHPYLSYVSLIIAVGSALRLAKFNIDTRQSDQFIGLPTPACTIFFSGLAWWFEDGRLINLSTENTVLLLIGLTVLFSYLLIAELRIIALKFKQYDISTNLFKYLLILLSVVMLVVLKGKGISLIIVLYILMSVLERLFQKSGNSSI